MNNHEKIWGVELKDSNMKIIYDLLSKEYYKLKESDNKDEEYFKKVENLFIKFMPKK